MSGPLEIPALLATSVSTVAIVAPSPVPLRLGGAERHWDALQSAFAAEGIAADVVKIPVRESNLLDLMNSYEQFRLLDLSHVDLVISGKYPAWMVQHQRHIIWMLHPLRGLYDTYNKAMFEHLRIPENQSVQDLVAALQRDAGPVDPLEIVDLVRTVDDDLGPTATDYQGPLSIPSPLARAVVQTLDRWALDPSRIDRYLAISDVVASREDYFPADADVSVLYPPPTLLEDEVPPPAAGKTFVSVGRLEQPKRANLAIEAMGFIDDPDARLRVLGDGTEHANLSALASKDSRISMEGFVDDAELSQAYRNSLAAIVTPLDEDFGYVTVEAMQHRRLVITTTDSGGPAEIAEDGADALVVQPEPRHIASAMEQLLSSPQLAAQLGDTARVTALQYSWPKAIRELLLEPDSAQAADNITLKNGGAKTSAKRVVAVSTYPILGAPGGGPQRCRALIAALARNGWDVVAVCFDAEDVARETDSSNLFRQVSVRPSQRHIDAETRLRRISGNVSITDISVSVLWPSNPDLVRTLRRELRDADAAIIVQPYLARAIREIAPEVPLILDSHNHEFELKEQMLPNDEAGQWLLNKVEQAEAVSVVNSVLISATTDADLVSLQRQYSSTSSAQTTTPSVVVPNAVNAKDIRFVSGSRRAENREEILRKLNSAGEPPRHIALFVGSAHMPNISAGAEIVKIAADLPEVLFVLAGAHSENVTAHHRPNVLLTGQLERSDLVRYLESADVALNPMGEGGGSNLKILEYFASGTPVISTEMGARGIDKPQRYATIADTADFPDAIRNILTDPPLETTRNARQLVDTEFEWEAVADQFAGAVNRVMEGRNTSE